MRAQRAGVIITISSVAAWEQYPNVAYKATKAGMIAFTQQVAIQNAEFGVRANVILPGLIDTPMAQALVWRLAGAFDRADDQHVAAAVAGSPNSNPIYVGLRKCLSERDRIAIIADLFPGVDFLARLSAARAKIPVVEYQCAKAGFGEYLGEPVEVHLLHGGKAMCHHNRWHLPGALLRQIVPSRKRLPVLRLELDVLSYGFLPLYRQLSLTASSRCSLACVRSSG